MAGTVPIITPNSITGITGLGHKPIYFVKLNGAQQATLVIKGENVMRANEDNEDALVSISWSSKIMKNINNSQVNSKIMAPNEITEFMRAARLAFPQGSDQAHHLNMPNNWVKMPKVDNLSDTDYLVRDNEGFSHEKLSLVKKTIKMLSEDNVWYELGKVVAVDLFNGNNDRFDDRGLWINKGNIMFTGNNVIGLDTFDPSGTNFGRLESNLVRGGGFEALKVLTEGQRRLQYASACTTSVGEELAGALRILKMTSVSIKMPDNSVAELSQPALKLLFMPFTPDFVRGLTDGSNQLKTYLQQKVQQYQLQFNVAPQQQQRANFAIGSNRGQGNRPTNTGFQMGHHRGNPQPQQPQQPRKTIPQGILDRMQYLGWL